jgi:hypothetical protein
MEEQETSPRAVLSAASRRQQENRYDAVLLDTLSVAAALNPAKTDVSKTFMVEGVMFESLTVNSNDAVGTQISYQDCVISTLDISMTEEGSAFPYFNRCLIGFLDGASSIPSWLRDRFSDCDIEQYSQQAHTTAGIMQLPIDPDTKIALTILKKVYSQRGSGRKEGALSRGLDQASKERVPTVIARLQSAGWVQRSSDRREVIYMPLKSRRADALRALDKPGDFKF